MILSILTRKTRISDRAQWEKQLAGVLPKIRPVLKGAPGFVSVQYLWASEEPGKVAQITTWLTPDDCRRYVREGDAATIATLEETAIPTAPYPHGAWNRITLEAVET